MFEYLLLNMIEIYLMNEMNIIHENYLLYIIYVCIVKNFEKKILFENFYFLENLNEN